MNYVSLFSGIEAASVAWEPLGWTPVAFSEIEPFPSAVLRYRFPDVPNLGDVTKVDWSPFRGAVDVVVGGSPCQSFSVAGNRGGLDDDRGRLMFEYVRAIRDLGPSWLVWENVPGVLSQDEGRAFGTLLGALDELGYGLAWRVLDAQFDRVAQRRRRVFIVGGPTAGRAAAVLFEPGCVPGGPGASKAKREELARAAGERLGVEGVGVNPICMTDTQPNALIDGDVCGALSATMHKDPPVAAYAVRMREGKPGGGKGPLATGSDQTLFHWDSDGWTVRRLTPLECERLQGFPDGWTDIPGSKDGPRYKALGNSMAVPVMRWIGERIQEVESIRDGDDL